MNLLIHDIATAIEREAKDGTRAVDLDPALDEADRFTVGRRAWRVPRHVAQLELDDPLPREPRR